MKFCSFEFFRLKTISIKDRTSFSYLDFRNESHSSRPFKWYITLARWVFLYHFGKMGQKKSVGKGLNMGLCGKLAKSISWSTSTPLDSDLSSG